MSNDSELFRTREWLEGEGYEITGNRFIKGDKVYVPLYEAKMIWQFDHWYATYEGATQANLNAGILPQIPEDRKQNLDTNVQPRYWVAQEKVKERLRDKWDKGWSLCFRRITNATSEQTAIFSLIPSAGVGDTAPLLISKESNASSLFLLLANGNSLVFNYAARKKIAGIHMDFHHIKQLPVIAPLVYSESNVLLIAPRVLELVYTAWDIRPFADDVWRDGDESLRAAIQNQWKDNQALTGGHGWQPPERAEIAEDGIPLPPFKWGEGRRARIRAQLDVYYAKLYGPTEEELRYILDPKDVYGQDFPGETFRVLKEKEIRQFGEYRTKRLVLEAWKEMEGSDKR